jgi:hypothetical protein
MSEYQFKSPFLVTEHSSDDMFVAMQREIQLKPLPGEIVSTGLWNATFKMLATILLICGAWWGWELFR